MNSRTTDWEWEEAVNENERILSTKNETKIWKQQVLKIDKNFLNKWKRKIKSWNIYKNGPTHQWLWPSDKNRGITAPMMKLSISLGRNWRSSLWACTSGRTCTVLTYRNVPALKSMQRPVELESTTFMSDCWKRLDIGRLVSGLIFLKAVGTYCAQDEECENRHDWCCQSKDGQMASDTGSVQAFMNEEWD